jgi:hypothetical protein
MFVHADGLRSIHDAQFFFYPNPINEPRALSYLHLPSQHEVCGMGSFQLG